MGFWSPAGPYLKDDLFPHSKGNFRARSITVSSVHVSFIMFINIIVVTSPQKLLNLGFPAIEQPLN